MMPLIAVLAYYAVLCGLSFWLYCADKRAAQRGRRRTAERTLLMIDMLGGWPGGLLAQRILRHKTRSPRFQIRFWCSAVLNLALAIWLLHPALA